MTRDTDPGEEYVITYSLSEHQHGSLVARFDSEPKEADARRHLAEYGITPEATTSISIQSLGTRGVSNGSLMSAPESKPDSESTQSRSKAPSDDSFMLAMMYVVPIILLIVTVYLRAL